MELAPEDDLAAQASLLMSIASEYFISRLGTDVKRYASGRQPSVIITDFKTTVVLEHDRLSRGIWFMASSLFKSTEHPVRFIIASEISAGLSMSMAHPYLHTDFPPDLLFRGAMPDPSRRQLPLEWILENVKSRSEFDVYLLARDEDQAMAYLKWKNYHRSAALANPVRVGAELAITVNAFRQHAAQLPFRVPAQPLTSETNEALQRYTRPRESWLDDLLQNTGTISVKVTRAVKTSLDGSGAQTFFCTIPSVDDEAHSTRGFCIKIFDERLLPSAEDVGEVYTVDDIDWNGSFIFATDVVGREDAAYRKLEHVQGSIVPHYYGAHQVRRHFPGQLGH